MKKLGYFSVHMQIGCILGFECFRPRPHVNASLDLGKAAIRMECTHIVPLNAGRLINVDQQSSESSPT